MDGLWWWEVCRIPIAAGGHHHLFKRLLKRKCVDTGSVLGFEQQGASPRGTETRLYWIVSFHFLLVRCCCCWVFFCSCLFNWPLWELLTFSHWVDTMDAPLFRLLHWIQTHWNANVFLAFASPLCFSHFFRCCLIKSRPFCYAELQLLPCVTYTLTHTHTHIAWHPQIEATPAALSILVSSMLPFSLEELRVESCCCILYLPPFPFCDSNCIPFNKGSYCAFKYWTWTTKFQ